MKPFAGVFLISLLLLASSIPAASAADMPDSAATGPDTSAVAVPPSAGSAPEVPAVTGLITVTLKNGTERQYQKVESWPGDFVRATRADGKYDYIPKYDIEKITSELTKDVLDHGAAVGKTKEEKAKEDKEDRISGFFRSRRLPDKKMFPITQAGLLQRFNSPPNASESSRNHWFDVGAMVNLSPKLALGGTVGIATDYNFTRITAKARLRRWLGNGALALDVAPGVFFPRSGTVFEPYPDFKRQGNGFVGELALSTSDYLSFSYMIEIVEVDATTYVPGTSIPLSGGSETDVGHFFGLKTGAGYGFLALGLMVLGSLASN